MNFDFSDELKQLKEEARRFLANKSSPAAVRRILEGPAGYDKELWSEMGAMGWTGASIPEELGGAGLGALGLCVLAEEIGRSLAPVPFSSTMYFAAEALMAGGSEAQQKTWLPRIAKGEVIGTFALAEGPGKATAKRVRTTFRNGLLNGDKLPVADGMAADLAIVVAQTDRGIGLVLADLSHAGVTRRGVETLDESRKQGQLTFADVPGELLAGGGDGERLLATIEQRAAILMAFEQVGGAQRCLEMARDYSLERYAFGRPIGSFQAIKHKLADVYVATELARSNAYYGAWALSKNAPQLALAAATARVSANEAFWLAAKENIQVHGGMGFTWAFDCHLYYRRAKSLAVANGSTRLWKERLVAELESQNAPA